MKTNPTFERHKAHFGPITKEIMDYVTNTVLLHSRYLFTKTAGGVQFAHCTHCNKRHRSEQPLKHNSKAVCPNCHSTCTVKASGISRKYLRDHAYVVYYQKSIIDPSIMVAMGFYVRRDYVGDYQNVETLYHPSCSYVFEMGNTTMFYTSFYGYDNHHWYQKANVTSEFSVYANGTPCWCSRESIEQAVVGTPFQYSTWEKYDEHNDWVKFFGLYSRYPCIEYLTKFGMKYFVYAKLYGYKTFGVINWRGKAMNEVLRLKKQDLKELRDSETDVSPLALRLFQMSRKDSNRLSLEELNSFARSTGDCFEDLKKLCKHTRNMSEAIVYIRRQFNRKSEQTRYKDMGGVIITWRDYLSDCRTLQLDMTQESVLFPINLFAAHQRSSVAASAKINKAANAKIAKRYKDLSKMVFECNGVIVRPFKTMKEIVDEGKTLNICIGGYAEKYGDGKSDLFCIRKIDDPKTPFFAMEVVNGKIVQTQGKGHCLPTAEVDAAVQAFKLEKLDKKPASKIKTPKRQQEVAV